MAKEGRPKGTGYVKDRAGRLSCVWKQGGKFHERRVKDKRTGEKMLTRVEDLRDEGLELPAAIARAFKEPEKPKGTATVEEVAAAYLGWLEREARRSPKNLAHERGRAKGLTEDPEIATARVDLLDRAAVARWTERLASGAIGGKPRQPRTLNRFLSLGSRIWRYALRHGYVPDGRPNPFRAIERAREPRLDKDPLTPAEGAALVAAAPEDFRPLLVAALATGCRRGELLGTTWQDIDLSNGVLVIGHAREKAGRGRHVPLTSELRELLTRMRKAAGPVLPAAPVFATADGKPHDARTVRDRVDVLRRLKVQGVPRRKLANLKFKDLRDSAICNLLALGVPTATVARVVGHSNLTTTEKYLGPLVEAQRAAIERYSAIRFGVAETGS